jgi:hypothetical protein
MASRLDLLERGHIVQFGRGCAAAAGFAVDHGHVGGRVTQIDPSEVDPQRQGRGRPLSQTPVPRRTTDPRLANVDQPSC